MFAGFGEIDAGEIGAFFRGGEVFLVLHRPGVKHFPNGQRVGVVHAGVGQCALRVQPVLPGYLFFPENDLQRLVQVHFFRPVGGMFRYGHNAHASCKKVGKTL